MSRKLIKTHSSSPLDRKQHAEATPSNANQHTTAPPISPDKTCLSRAAESPEPPNYHNEMRILEATLFASDKALSISQMAECLADGVDIKAVLKMLSAEYANRGVNIIQLDGKWMFRTAPDLAHVLHKHAIEERRLSRAALETLAIIAYHQPVTRAEIEDVRGVSTSKGTLDVLMETGWVRPRGRRRAPGRPVTYGTTEDFLQHFGLDGLRDLPGLAELKGAGLLDTTLPPDFRMPEPRELASLLPDELPLATEDDADTESPGNINDETDQDDEDDCALP